MVNLVDGARETKRVLRIAATMELGEVRLVGRARAVSTEVLEPACPLLPVAVPGAPELPTVSIARNAATWLAAVRYGQAVARLDSIAPPVRAVRT